MGSSISIIIALIAVLLSFYGLLLGLLRIFPLWVAAPALLLSILYLVYRWNRRHQFRGF
ncbi:hypothetical protein [Texcoconibacillus texcoconensis]|uniref:Apolipoprotein N-acyltransferase n=1 Tax=Texcoconibacillus texcoconensis TaxID=1095777 RepID=A0A840QUB4_9BACI|nr:hypothetical protein [Texcoconibacillus texcoconensis]MBB5174847.1 apolipoprotein N-acyltransferase [Texcoconibacillus texcoconensis]